MGAIQFGRTHIVDGSVFGGWVSLLERGDQRSDLTLANLLLARGAPDCCAGKHIGLLENGKAVGVQAIPG